MRLPGPRTGGVRRCEPYRDGDIPAEGNVVVHIPSLVNGVAIALGHAMSVPAEEAKECHSVAEWHKRATAALEAYIASKAEMERRVRANTPGPSAFWELDKETNMVSYTTPSGRLRIAATDGWILLTIEAGPMRRHYSNVGAFVREPSGLYRWVPGEEDIFICPGTSTSSYVKWRGPEDIPDRVVISYDPKSGFAVHSLSLPGRPVVQAGIDEEGRPFVEWVAPDLVIKERRPDRAELLVLIDKKVFGGALAAADKTGILASVAASLAAARNEEE
jgi:hypothetical protein